MIYLDDEKLKQELRSIRVRKLFKFRDEIWNRQKRIERKIWNLKLELFIIDSNLKPPYMDSMKLDNLKQHLIDVKAVQLSDRQDDIKEEIEELENKKRFLNRAGIKIIIDDIRNEIVDDKDADWW